MVVTMEVANAFNSGSLVAVDVPTYLAAITHRYMQKQRLRYDNGTRGASSSRVCHNSPYRAHCSEASGTLSNISVPEEAVVARVCVCLCVSEPGRGIASEHSNSSRCPL